MDLLLYLLLFLLKILCQYLFLFSLLVNIWVCSCSLLRIPQLNFCLSILCSFLFSFFFFLPVSHPDLWSCSPTTMSLMPCSFLHLSHSLCLFSVISTLVLTLMVSQALHTCLACDPFVFPFSSFESSSCLREVYMHMRNRSRWLLAPVPWFPICYLSQLFLIPNFIWSCLFSQQFWAVYFTVWISSLGFSSFLAHPVFFFLFFFCAFKISFRD